MATTTKPARKPRNSAVVSPKADESWNQKHWRSCFAWVYMIICLYDFVLGPILFQVLEFYNPGQDITAYQAVTLQGGGVAHIALGSICGISSFGRTKEKLANNS